MVTKVTNKALQQRIQELEQEVSAYKQLHKELKQARAEQAQLIDMTNALLYELNLERLLVKIMQTSKVLLQAERCTLFLYDEQTRELWARATDGSETTELRFPCQLGIAGTVFTTGIGINIPDAYADPRFNKEMDKKTGFRTHSILCMPLKNKVGRILGVAQVLNKVRGPFTAHDETRLSAFTAHACIALENAKLFQELMGKVRALQTEIHAHEHAREALKQARDEEVRLLEMTSELSQELNLGQLLLNIMHTTTILLAAERCTLFLYDQKTDELWAKATDKADTGAIRFPSHLGIAGRVFTSGETINIPDAYNDPRFNQDVDKKTGFRTRSILCMPVKHKDGHLLGVTQVLNKHNGPFTEIDEQRLRAISAQASIALENAKLFEDVLDMKNYTEGMLQSMSNGVLSLDADKHIVKANAAALRILQCDGFEQLAGKPLGALFAETNPWLVESIETVTQTMRSDVALDTGLTLQNGNVVSVNLTIVPLLNIRGRLIGSLLVLEDITREKRLKSTMTRYMAKEVVERLLERGEAMLGGITQEATIMFTDIRSFTTISERNTPQETVSMLNEYFSLMVDIIFKYEGILDKYIGDAILAVFGAPFSSGNDPDRAVKTAIDMLSALQVFNRHRQADGKEAINIGIGISTNHILTGNIGSLKRMDYTVIGDGVNIASRLESANKIYGTHILISEFTYYKIQERYISRELDLIRVKGKTKPISVYQILAEHEADAFPHVHDAFDVFHDGLCHYRNRAWNKGLDCFRHILKLNPGDTVSTLYLERCRYFLQNPPADDWDHVWTLKTK